MAAYEIKVDEAVEKEKWIMVAMSHSCGLSLVTVRELVDS